MVCELSQLTFFKNLLTYFWLCCIFIAAQAPIQLQCLGSRACGPQRLQFTGSGACRPL